MGDEEERSGSLMVALPVVLTKSHVTMLKSMVTGIGDIDAPMQFRLTYPCFSLSTYVFSLKIMREYKSSITIDAEIDLGTEFKG